MPHLRKPSNEDNYVFAKQVTYNRQLDKAKETNETNWVNNER
jgi:hypothetical protein